MLTPPAGILLALFAVPLKAVAQKQWQDYVLAPSSRNVSPIGVLRTSAAGVDNPKGLLSGNGNPTRLTAVSQSNWPSGTTASASSVHPPNNGNGDGPRTYDAPNAIDGDISTFWNDDTESSYPDVLTITLPSGTTTTLPGITIISSVDGVPQDLYVETSPDGANWTKQTTVSGNGAVSIPVIFPSIVTFTALRITITNDQNAGKGVYTRIAEVVPRISWPNGTTASASSVHAPNDGNGGGTRTYDASNAIDGNATTFWNDDTESAYPDVLTIILPSGSSSTLPGITIVSSSDGVPTELYVETSPDGSAWTKQATISGNVDVSIAVSFPSTVTLSALRITVTGDQNAGKGVYTRIAEVVPGLEVQPFIDIDFGIVLGGHLVVDIAGSSNPAPQLRIAFSETQECLGFSSDYSPSDYYSSHGGADDHVPAVGGETWVDIKACQFGTQICADGLRGFRFARIYVAQTPGAESLSAANGWVDIRSVKVQFTPFLGTADTYRGHFLSSDDLLNRIWYASAYTVELNTDTFSANDVDPRNAFSSSLDGKIVLFDGTKRDRDPYGGDVAVQSLVDLVSHANGTGAKNVLADLAAHQRSDGFVPPASINNYGLLLFDYPAYWAIGTTDYVRYTADTTFAGQSWNAMKSLMDTWYPSVTNSAGLLEKTDTSYGDYAFLPRSGVVTYYNANYVRALRGASQFATLLGHPDEASSWSTRADTVATALNNSAAWDASVGAWKDTTASTCHSQDATGYATIAGIGGIQRAKASLAYTDRTLRRAWGNSFVDDDCFGSGTSDRVYGFISYPEVLARFVVGDDDGALEQLRRTWGWMIDREPGNTTWEGVGSNGDVANYEGGFSSMAHGWAAGAAPALTNKLLGVEPTLAGFQTYDVLPHPGNVTWANGTIPTPHGDLVIGWTRPAGGSLTLEVNAPTDTTGRFGVPVANSAQVHLDGTLVWEGSSAVSGSNATTDGLYVFINGIVSGSHVLVGAPK